MTPRGGARAGSGPKKRLDGRKVLSISFDTVTLEKLGFWSKRLGLSRSEAIRRIVAEARLPSKINPTTEASNGNHEEDNHEEDNHEEASGTEAEAPAGGDEPS